MICYKKNHLKLKCIKLKIYKLFSSKKCLKFSTFIAIKIGNLKQGFT